MAARAYEWRDSRKITAVLGATQSAGDLANLGGLPGVILDDGVSGDSVPFAVEGGVKIPKATGFALSLGDPVYVDTGTDQRAESSAALTFFGICIEEAASGDTEVWVRLSGGSPAFAKNNTVATAAPAVTNDVDEGYSVGSRWYDITNDVAYVCLDNSDGAAVWKREAGGVVEGSVTFGAADTSKTVAIGALYNSKPVFLSDAQQDQGACTDAFGAVSAGTLTITGTAPGVGKTAIYNYRVAVSP